MGRCTMSLRSGKKLNVVRRPAPIRYWSIWLTWGTAQCYLLTSGHSQKVSASVGLMPDLQGQFTSQGQIYL